MKPLFIPLKTQYFEQFERGIKTVEYRLFGPRWNERTCIPGRAVTLSKGYSGPRISGVIERLEVKVMDILTRGEHREIACIHLRLTPSDALGRAGIASGMQG